MDSEFIVEVRASSSLDEEELEQEVLNQEGVEECKYEIKRESFTVVEWVAIGTFALEATDKLVKLIKYLKEEYDEDVEPQVYHDGDIVFKNEVDAETVKQYDGEVIAEIGDETYYQMKGKMASKFKQELEDEDN